MAWQIPRRNLSTGVAATLDRRHGVLHLFRDGQSMTVKDANCRGVVLAAMTITAEPVRRMMEVP